MQQVTIRSGEKIFWQLIAGIICALLIACVIFNYHDPTIIPPQVVPFLLGSLLAVGVGYSVVAPRSSPMILSKEKERKTRHQQYLAGLVMSVLIALLFLSPELRAQPSSWVLIPIIFLSPVLVFREIVLRK